MLSVLAASQMQKRRIARTASAPSRHFQGYTRLLDFETDTGCLSDSALRTPCQCQVKTGYCCTRGQQAASTLLQIITSK